MILQDKQDTSIRTALVLGAHPDDEMGCAGLICRLRDAGVEVHHYYFSDCAISTRDRGHPPEKLLNECAESRRILDISPEHSGGFDFPVREFPRLRQEILDALIGLRQKINPQLVLTACRDDIHQDHSTLTVEAIRAFKYATILGYELPWNCRVMRHDVLIRLDESHITRKIEAIQSYESQRGSIYTDPEVIRSLARVRGLQCGERYAECYELIRGIF